MQNNFYKKDFAHEAGMFFLFLKGSLYRSNLKNRFWAISKLSQFVDLNRLNINNIKSVEIGKFGCSISLK